MKPIYIVFTGGCHSGKTTSIQIINKILEEKGKKLIIFSEIIRNHNIVSIDEIRLDANKYMDLQYQIINEKIDMELSMINYEDEIYDTYVLVDRAITDSLFYLTFYTNKNEFNDESKEKFYYTFNRIYKHLNHIKDVYNIILEFKPLNKIQENDSFRPENLNKMKDIEYIMIQNLNKAYFGNLERYHQIDLNNVDKDKMYNFWKQYLENNIIL